MMIICYLDKTSQKQYITCKDVYECTDKIVELLDDIPSENILKVKEVE